jgi:hypothetical protein
VDEAQADALLSSLIAWGLVEERSGAVAPTRRWNAKLQAAAERLNQEVERTGTYPAGNPLVLAVAAALREERPELDGAARDDAVRMLVTLELSRMDQTKRDRYGFGSVRL